MVSHLFWAVALAEDEPASGLDVGLGASLLISITMMMGLYYITNFPDPDIRRYAYEVLNSTISIFCAVLLFSAGNDVFEKEVVGHLDPKWATSARVGVTVFWFTVLQLVTARLAHQFEDEDTRKKHEFVHQHHETTDVNLSSAGVLLAHISGFACINLFGHLQQQHRFSASPFASLGSAVLALCFCAFMNKITRVIRHQLIHRDKDMDEFEEMWDEAVQESENDVFSLCVSFLCVQSLRFAVSGTLPNDEGDEAVATLFHHSWYEPVLLILFGSAGSLVLTMYFLGLRSVKKNEKPKGLARRVTMSVDGVLTRLKKASTMEVASVPLIEWERVSELFCTTISHASAWAILFGAKWAIAGLLTVEDETILNLLCAFVLSGFCCAFIWVLDNIQDSVRAEAREARDGDNAEQSKERVEITSEIIRHLVDQVGIIIGFGWERCFDGAVVAVASPTPNPLVTKFILAVLCAVVVLPAWRLYLVPMVVLQGWRFGFLPHHVVKHAANNEDCEETQKKYDELLQTLTGAHPDKEKRQKYNDLHSKAGSDHSHPVPKLKLPEAAAGSLLAPASQLTGYVALSPRGVKQLVVR
mmetsp:Transcript_75056/g.172036  ORF Transcript_75056/g.172036 Transcript_75056/m.172036 type:complete len:585 (-) Transcript_75056:54-1808(-)